MMDIFSLSLTPSFSSTFIPLENACGRSGTHSLRCRAVCLGLRDKMHTPNSAQLYLGSLIFILLPDAGNFPGTVLATFGRVTIVIIQGRSTKRKQQSIGPGHNGCCSHGFFVVEIPVYDFHVLELYIRQPISHWLDPQLLFCCALAHESVFFLEV